MFRPKSLFLATLGGLAFVALSFTAVSTAHGQGIPNWIHYQGRLTNPDGVPVTDGAWPVVFRLYDSPTGESVLWSETRSVTTRGGAFSTTLGQIAAFDPALFARPLWLEIEVNGRKLAPRQALGAVPFAMTALSVPGGSVTTVMIANLSVTAEKIAEGAITESKLAPGLAIPVGGVISWWGNAASPPAGWQVCDGSTVADSASPLNGQALPDLRNRFVRGATGDVRTSPVVGGEDSIDLTHTHPISPDGDHRHGLSSGYASIGYGGDTRLGWRKWGNVSEGRNSFQGLENIVLNGATVDYGWEATALGGSTDAAGTHSHGGATGSSLGERAILPRYVGLVYIVRVR